jgi:hypothetical protein
MTANGDEPLNSRTITVWLPRADIDYVLEYAGELGLANRDGSPNRNGAFRAIIEEHRRLRTKRLSRKR